MSEFRLRVVSDGELGAVAAAVDADGKIVATASSGLEHGVYIVMDEARIYELTGELLPAPLWDACTDNDE